MRVYTSRIHWVDRGTGTPKDKDLVTINFVSDVHTTILYETLQVVGLAEAARTAIRLRKKTMNLCACDSEERERGVGVGVNVTMMSDTPSIVGVVGVRGRRRFR
jgi:hypothetical protein